MGGVFSRLCFHCDALVECIQTGSPGDALASWPGDSRPGICLKETEECTATSLLFVGLQSDVKPNIQL